MMSTNVTFNFKGKKALVTGAGRGIGRGIAIALSGAGAETYALSKTKEHLDSLVAECPGIKPVCVDLTDWEATRKAVEKLGPIDLLVNNAAITLGAVLLDIKPENFDKCIDINVKAALNVSQVVAKGLIAKGRPGSIVNVSSQSAVRAYVGNACYGSSKAALDHLARHMAVEFGPKKIRVNSVNLTVILAGMGMPVAEHKEISGQLIARIPLGRFGELCDAVDPVLFLLSDAAQMIHGANLMVDGGFTVG